MSDGGSITDRLDLRSNSTNRISQEIRTAASNNAISSAGNSWPEDGTFIAVATAYEISNANGYVDGVVFSTIAQPLGLPTDVDRFYVGANYEGLDPLNGHIAEIRYYNTRHTDAELEDMSNGIFPTFGPFYGINGTAVNGAGAVQVSAVARGYTVLATDVYINGTLHSVDGVMYVCTAAPSGANMFINGILHTETGIRYVETTGGANAWPEGFATADDGVQLITTSPTGETFLRGIARGSDGAMST